ncbi:hypothetical protein HYQ46_006792 [Verticillium longisporum]|nr:hypothetical protein HYQ46_006792 [Verticillium longisporum]
MDLVAVIPKVQVLGTSSLLTPETLNASCRLGTISKATRERSGRQTSRMTDVFPPERWLSYGYVNAQLLESVLFEDLETVNIKNANGVLGSLLGLERLVDAVDDPVEEVVVDSFRKGIARGNGLSGVGWGFNDLAVAWGEDSNRDGLDKLLGCHLEQVSQEIHDRLIRDGGISLLVLLELDVTRPQYSRKHTEDLILFRLVETNNLHGVKCVLVLSEIVDSVHVETFRSARVSNLGLRGVVSILEIRIVLPAALSPVRVRYAIACYRKMQDAERVRLRKGRVLW